MRTQDGGEGEGEDEDEDGTNTNFDIGEGDFDAFNSSMRNEHKRSFYVAMQEKDASSKYKSFHTDIELQQFYNTLTSIEFGAKKNTQQSTTLK
jgi:hypothetical protein